MASKIFDTQNWRIYCDTEEDQSEATAMQILARSPSGVISTFTAILDDGDNNRIYYDVGVEEMTEVGDWHIYPRTTVVSKIATGDSSVVTIYTEGY
jgi:hypothetical protein